MPLPTIMIQISVTFRPENSAGSSRVLLPWQWRAQQETMAPGPLGPAADSVLDDVKRDGRNWNFYY